MDSLSVDARYQSLFDELRIKNCAQAFDFFVDPHRDPCDKQFIKTMELSWAGKPLPVFFKQYAFARPSWKFLGRASKARREFENYDVFQRLGISSAERVACGEQRDWLGRLRCAFIVTRAVPNATTLLEFVPKHCPDAASPEKEKMRETIIVQLAAMTRRIHEASFFHNDLFWRNILVQLAAGGEPKLLWIDCPRGKFKSWLFRPYRARLRDLAALDQPAEKFFTPRERMTFMKLYLGQERPNAAAKQVIRDTLAYRRDHWSG
jgi:lipopolysaccharide kinase (Kdo/WaaP) family protein